RAGERAQRDEGQAGRVPAEEQEGGHDEREHQADAHGRRQHHEDRRDARVTSEQRHRVPGGPEEERLPEAHDAREAPDEVEAQGQQREDHHPRDEHDPELRQHRRQHREHREQRNLEGGDACRRRCLQHSLGSTRPLLRATCFYVDPLTTAVYIRILQWRLPGTISAGPPGPSAIFAWSSAFATASRFTDFASLTAASQSLSPRYIPVAALPAANAILPGNCLSYSAWIRALGASSFVTTLK